MKLLATVVVLWAWTGFVSCDEPEQVEAAVRASLPDAKGVEVTCREPRLWYSEHDWLCDAYVKGLRHCYKVHTADQPPWEVSCARPEEMEKIQLPAASPTTTVP